MTVTDEKTPALDEAVDHIAELWDLFKQHLLEKLTPDHLDCIVLDDTLVSESIRNALIDYNRMCRHHLPQEHQSPDRHKHAGFFSKWIAKSRPIVVDFERIKQIDNVKNDKYDAIAYRNFLILIKINASFALLVFRSFLKYDIPDAIYPSLLYSFHFRDWTGENLALHAYSCEKIAELETV